MLGRAVTARDLYARSHCCRSWRGQVTRASSKTRAVQLRESQFATVVESSARFFQRGLPQTFVKRNRTDPMVWCTICKTSDVSEARSLELTAVEKKTASLKGTSINHCSLILPVS